MITVRQAPKYYFVEILGAAALYMATMFWRPGFVASHAAPSLLRDAAILSPILPCCLMVLAIVRFYQRMDEMHRRQTLEHVAFGALVCALASLALGFGEDAGLPRIGIFWAWPLMGAGWMLIVIWRGLACMIAQKGAARTASILAVRLGLIALPTAAYALAAPALGWPHTFRAIALVATGFLMAQAGWQTFKRDA